VLNDQVSVLKLAANHDVEKRPEASHSDFSMLVHECGEKGPAHYLTKMDQLFVATDGKLLHTVATFNDYLTGRIHTDCPQNIYNLLSVGSHAVKDRGGNHDSDYFS